MSVMTLRKTRALLALLGIASVLSACNTTAGAGKDISNTGNAITRAANDTTPR